MFRQFGTPQPIPLLSWMHAVNGEEAILVRQGERDVLAIGLSCGPTCEGSVVLPGLRPEIPPKWLRESRKRVHRRDAGEKKVLRRGPRGPQRHQRVGVFQ